MVIFAMQMHRMIAGLATERYGLEKRVLSFYN